MLTVRDAEEALRRLRNMRREVQRQRARGDPA
jgi:hypothetical protein